MESRFGHDFSQVRIHKDGRAAASAGEINAHAYTVGSNIAFGAGKYVPDRQEGLRLLAHELVHVVQQSGMQKSGTSPVEPLAGGVQRIAVAPALEEPSSELERQAEMVGRLVAEPEAREIPAIQRISTGSRVGPAVQPYRVGLPRPIPLCGRTLTHIDIEAPRTRPLAHCGLPAVTRMNIVGRQVSPSTTGRGRIIFNLHIGYFRNATGHLCAIVDDSMGCVAGRCQILGCFPTLREVLDALKDFLWDALKIIGIIILAIIIALFLRGFRGAPAPGGAPAPALARGEGEGEGGAEEGGEDAVAEA